MGQKIFSINHSPARLLSGYPDIIISCWGKQTRETHIKDDETGSGFAVTHSKQTRTNVDEQFSPPILFHKLCMQRIDTEEEER